MRTVLSLLFISTLTISTLTAFQNDSAVAQSIERHVKAANRLVELMNAEDYPGIESLFSKEMAAALPLEKCTAFFKSLHQQRGKIKKLDPPRPQPPAMLFTAHFERGLLDLQLSLNDREQITGLYFKPHISSKPPPEKHRTELTLPFRDKWLVFWGGDTSEQNYHHDTPNQRFAFDFLGVGPDGKTRRGQRSKNEDYYAFGREVLAPGEGKVIEVIEGVRDNMPGSMNPYSAVGNCVMIQHRDDEVSVLAHFKQGSVKVKVGDAVRSGQVLGQCGNSGNSSEPHIHYHLQHSPILQDGLGIKCAFSKVVLNQDDETVVRTNYSPVKGDIISPQ